MRIIEAQREAEDNMESYDRYTILLDEVFFLPAAGCVASGIVKGGTAALRDEVWILSAEGGCIHTYITAMGVFSGEVVRRATSAENMSRVGILLKDIKEDSVLEGSIITNIEPNIDDEKKVFENSWLKGLLAGRNDALIGEMDKRIQSEMERRGKFLAVVIWDGETEDDNEGTATFNADSSVSFPCLTNPYGQAYQPVFTGWEELRGWEHDDAAENRVIIVNKADIQDLLKNSAAQGIVVNPFTDSLIIDRE